MHRFGIVLSFIPIWIGLAASAGAAFQPQSTTGNACAWRIFATPNTSSGVNELLSISATSANDVWAVGYHRDNRTGNSWPLTEHFNGTAWSLVSSPQPKFSTLLGVAEISPSDAWAVGAIFNQSTGGVKTLTMHWDGSTWTMIRSPNGADDNGFLTSVAFSSTNDVWAFGYSQNRNNRTVTLALHWDGSAWSVIPTANLPGNDLLWGGGAVNSGDVWAVGNVEGSGPSQLIEMWNGASWSAVTSPNIFGGFRAYVPITPNDAWAIGHSSNGVNATPLAEFWNGSTFSVVPTPTVSGRDTFIYGAAAVSADDVWAVGLAQAYDDDQTFTMNWNGSSWVAVTSPNRGAAGDDLYGVASIPGTVDVWAVGTSLTDQAHNKTLAMKLHC